MSLTVDKIPTTILLCFNNSSKFRKSVPAQCSLFVYVLKYDIFVFKHSLFTEETLHCYEQVQFSSAVKLFQL